MKAALLIGTALLLAGGPALAQQPAPREPLEANVRLWFDGNSTVRAFTCNAQVLNARITSDAPDVAAAEVAALVSRAVITVPVAALECNNGKMNDHMRKALKAEAAPEIRFVLTSYRMQGDVAHIDGTLAMAGQTRAVQIPAAVTSEAGGVRVRAETPIDMTMWGIKPPSLMLGTMKVNPTVSVNFDVLVKR